MKNFFNSLGKLLGGILLIIIGSWYLYFFISSFIEEYKIKNEGTLIESEIVSQKEWKKYEGGEVLEYSPIVKIEINGKVSVKELDDLKKNSSFTVGNKIKLYYLNDKVKSPENITPILGIIFLLLIGFGKVFIGIYFIKNFKKNDVYMEKKDLFPNIKENLFIALITIFVVIIFYFIFDSQGLEETNEKVNYISFSGGLEQNSDIIINNFKIFIENTELYNLSLSYGSEMKSLGEEYQNDLKNKVGILDLSELFLEDKDIKNKEKIFALISKLNLLKDSSKNYLIKRDVIIKKYSDLENTFNAIGVNILHENENIAFSSQELFINTAIDFYTYLLSIQDSVVMENNILIGIKGENNGKKYNDFVELLNKNYTTYEQNYNNLIKSKSLYQELVKNIPN